MAAAAGDSRAGDPRRGRRHPAPRRRRWWLRRWHPPPPTPPTPPAVASTSAAPDPEATVRRAYEAALSKQRAGDSAGAVADFRTFLKLYPRNELAPNAQYWLGEAYFRMADYPNAIAAQQKLLVTHPDHLKAPDAMLILANAQSANGDQSRRAPDARRPDREASAVGGRGEGQAASRTAEVMPAEVAATLPDRAAVKPPVRLRLTEIFLSLQGEASRVGLPTVFVRLTGCPLRCGYCDTAYAFHGGETFDARDHRRTRARLRRAARDRDRRRAAGAEGLSRPAAGAVRCGLRRLARNQRRARRGRRGRARIEDSRPQDAGLGRNGAQPVGEPRSPDARATRSSSCSAIAPTTNGRGRSCGIGRSRNGAPCCSRRRTDSCEPRQLAEWILEDRLPVRMQLQLHKLLWGETPGH